MLLQRTRSNKVEAVYREFIAEYPNLDALAEADKEDLATILEPLGLQNKRAEALVQIAERLHEEGIPGTE